MALPPPTPAQARLIWSAASALAFAALVAVGVGLVWGLGKVLGVLSPVLWPLAVAGVLAYLLDPVVDFIQRRGVPRGRAILCVFALAAGIVFALGGSVVPQIVREARQLVEQVPDYSLRIQRKVEAWVNHPPALLRKYLHLLPEVTPGTNAIPATNPPPTTGAPPAADSVEAPPSFLGGALDKGTLQSATSWLANALPKIGAWALEQVTKVASWFGVLAGLALIPIYTFYFLLEKEGIKGRWSDYVPLTQSSLRDELVFVLRSINDYLIVFFRGQVLVAMCDGALYALGFLIIGLPYAVLVGAMATVLTMIPYLGAMTTCATALVIALVQFGDWQHPLRVLAVFAVVQALEGFVISPKIIGDRVGLHPLAIIIAVVAGTTLLGGLLGGILAIPLTAALRVIMFRYVWKKREAPAA